MKKNIAYQEQAETFECMARHIEGTEMCMLTLPCKYTDKKVRFSVEVIDR
jgi:hypothetical protein